MVRDSNSGHQLLLPPANWCPTFASRTTQEVTQWVVGWFYFFLILNVFLVSALSGSIIDSVQLWVLQPQKIAETLGRTLPEKSAFFVSYVLLKAGLLPLRCAAAAAAAAASPPYHKGTSTAGQSERLPTLDKPPPLAQLSSTALAPAPRPADRLCRVGDNAKLFAYRLYSSCRRKPVTLRKRAELLGHVAG